MKGLIHFVLIAGIGIHSACNLDKEKHPNIVYILADDMGFGDVSCLNQDSKISTSNLDMLAGEGITFMDAHSGSAVCIPTRIGILTGRYCWRSYLKNSVLWPWDGPLIEPDRFTVGDFLKQHGYTTACIGKWHLGWEWPTLDGALLEDQVPLRGNGTRQSGIPWQKKLIFLQRSGMVPFLEVLTTISAMMFPTFLPIVLLKTTGPLGFR